MFIPYVQSCSLPFIYDLFMIKTQNWALELENLMANQTDHFHTVLQHDVSLITKNAMQFNSSGTIYFRQV